jgi:hypothetical protein
VGSAVGRSGETRPVPAACQASFVAAGKRLEVAMRATCRGLFTNDSQQVLGGLTGPARETLRDLYVRESGRQELGMTIYCPEDDDVYGVSGRLPGSDMV